MSNVVNKYFKVGSDGFVALKDYMGSDESIEQAARISYGKGTRKKNETRGLLRYLMRHHHTSPFEQAELQFHVRVSMDTWRQWIRHRTANVNEYSTRYSEAIDSQVATPPDKWRLQAENNKQGSGDFIDSVLDDYMHCPVTGINYQPERFKTGEILSEIEKDFHSLAKEVYNQRIEAGVAREQARKDLPLSTYTEAFWKCDLHNLLHFLSLRCDSHSQLEIREYANVIAGIVKELFPLTFEAWESYAFKSVTFSREEMKLMCVLEGRDGAGMIAPISYDFLRSASKEDWYYKHATEELGMSKREIIEFCDKLERAWNDDRRSEFSLEGIEEYER